MGTAASKRADGAGAGSSASSSSYSKNDAATAAANLSLPGSPNRPSNSNRRQESYEVIAHENFGDLQGTICTLIVGIEALRIHRAVDNTLLAHFPYHEILCWGFDSRLFQWKSFMTFSSTTTTSTTTSSSSSKEEDPSTSSSTSSSSSSSKTFPAGKTLADAPTLTYSALTEDGSEIEERVMTAVVALMSSMKSATAVPDAMFQVLVQTLPELADAGLGDHCLTAVKQMAVQRKFTARQAVELLTELEKISPFDKLEAAVVLHDALISEDAFLMILGTFEDTGEQANLLHRLGLIVTSEGKLERVGKAIGVGAKQK